MALSYTCVPEPKGSDYFDAAWNLCLWADTPDRAFLMRPSIQAQTTTHEASHPKQRVANARSGEIPPLHPTLDVGLSLQLS
jgi:uncharacterized protein with von Willebrand factor type A (vWA) domain